MVYFHIRCKQSETMNYHVNLYSFQYGLTHTVCCLLNLIPGITPCRIDHPLIRHAER